jgi:glycosyltransferase involved in cell wall biosynthesis
MPSGVSVVIPALNEEGSIGSVVRSMPWDSIDECIVVDNGSTDQTGQVAAAAGARVIKAPRGYGSAMAAGSAAARPTTDLLVYMDGDGADDVTEMPRFLQPLRSGEADFVIGSRIRGQRERGSMLGSQVFAAHLIGSLVKVLYGFRYTDMCAFRAIRRDALERMHMREMTFGWNLEMQIKAVRMGLRIQEIPVRYRNRIAGVSKVSGDLRASFLAGRRILGVFWRVRRQKG